MPTIRIRVDARLQAKAQVKAAIDLDQIVSAALQLLDEVGLDKLTMRRLAERLNIKAASLYWHVQEKDELIALLADAICASLKAPDPTLPWRKQLERFGEEYRRVLLSHRDAARVMLLSGPPSGANRLDLVETLLSVLLNAGFSPQDATFAGFMMNDYVTTFVMEETRDNASPASQTPGEIPQQSSGVNWIDALPPDRYPHIRALIPHLLNVNLDEQFHFGTQVLLDGLEKRLNAAND